MATALPRVVTAEPLGDLRLRLTFSDGLIRELDFEGTLRGGGVESLNDPVFFEQVTVDPVAGTIAWPNGVDLDPDVLHGDEVPANGPAPKLLSERRLRTTG